MKKILSLTLISSVALMLITGCGGSEPSVKNPSIKDPSVNKNALYINTHDNEKIAKSIHEAAKKAGWRITEFKQNALIAEKIDGDTAYATTAKFHDGHIEFDNEEGTSDSDISDLKDAIKDALKENSPE